MLVITWIRSSKWIWKAMQFIICKSYLNFFNEKFLRPFVLAIFGTHLCFLNNLLWSGLAPYGRENVGPQVESHTCFQYHIYNSLKCKISKFVTLSMLKSTLICLWHCDMVEMLYYKVRGILELFILKCLCLMWSLLNLICILKWCMARLGILE